MAAWPPVTRVPYHRRMDNPRHDRLTVVVAACNEAEALPLLQRVGRLIAEDLARGRFAGDDSSVGSVGRE